jgi:hypothetical protein
MRVLFSMRHLGSFRMYESVLRRLAEAGHEVDVVASHRDSLGEGGVPDALLPDVPGIRWSWEEIHPNAWLELATAVRIWIDYLRYFEPAYARAPRLRRRAAERVPVLLRRITEWRAVRTVAGRRALAACLRAIERALPRQKTVDTLMRERRPDVVLLTPLLHLGSPQIEVLRSARAYGARTALCVGSWDHLSSKSLIRELPDRIFVWNETQRREAVELHGVAADRVTVTGAQCYDHWFGRAPIRTRDEFCSMLKLPPDKPFLLWVCSALFVGSPSEARLVRQWIEHIRASADPLLRSAGILVRPHPARLDEWRDVDLSDLPDVTLYGSMPVNTAAKEDYFESLSYSAAVVGLNTSAFLEAAIVSRPVYTIVLPEFRENQDGTLHFQYLRSVGGGLLNVAHDFDEHRAQLAAALREPDRPDRNATFVEAFIRPHGLDRAATDVFVDAVEELGRVAATPARAPAWAPALRLALFPLALAVHSAIVGTAAPGDRTSVELQRARRKEEHRREREAEEQRLRAARDADRAEKAARAEAARQAALAAKQARLDASERHKRDVRTAKAREKLQRERAKRRAAFKSLVKRRLGFGSRQVP